MNLTPLGLKKPLTTESYDIAIPNFNADLLDTLLTAQQAILNAAQQYKLTANTGYVLRDAVDCNSEIASGIYSLTAASTNKPSAEVGILQVWRRDASIIFQVAFNTTSNVLYMRNSINAGAAWSAWKTIATNVDLALKLDAATYSAADILTKIKTVDGLGSGLDADLFQGNLPAAFATAGHNHTLDALSNALIVSNSAGEILKWDGSKWINNTLAEAGIAAASHLHTIANVTGLQTALDAKQATITGGASSVASADLTASRALASDASGKIAVLAVTAAELAFVAGVTSAIQTQLDGKQATITGAASTIDTENLTVSKALVSDASGKVAAAAVSAIELGYLAGVTSAIQTQLNTKQATITGAASTIDTENLTINKVLISDASGKVAVGGASTAELAYLAGVTAAIQGQIDGKQSLITGGASTIAAANLTASRVLVSDVSGKVAVALVTSVELAYLDGVTSAIQTQINAKQATIVGGASSIAAANLTADRALVSDSSGKVAVSVVGSTELAYLDGVTSAIQTQLDGKLGSTAQAVDSLKVGGKKVTVGTAAPGSPAVGDVWIDTN